MVTPTYMYEETLNIHYVGHTFQHHKVIPWFNVVARFSFMAELLKLSTKCST